MNRLKQYEMPPAKCLACGALHDGATALFHNRKPRPGGATMCIKCGVFMIYTDDMQYRPPTAEEMTQLMGDSRVQQMIRAHTETHGMTKQ